MTPEDFKFLQDNAPDATDAQIAEAYSHNQGDLLKTLSALHKVPPPPEKVLTEWEKRRAIFDDLDKQMQDRVKGKRT